MSKRTYGRLVKVMQQTKEATLDYREDRPTWTVKLHCGHEIEVNAFELVLMHTCNECETKCIGMLDNVARS